MIIQFTVAVELERVSGRFIAKDDLAQEIEDSLEAANPGDLNIDESEYTVSDFTVERVF